jgi:prepilin-type N-terminal cleavage/methylation domain-containing protein
MNINQMKASIAKFRKADLSVIKDAKLRAKGQKLQDKEKGFTLLELLVVIALLATLATAALIAYENVGDNAQAAAAANTASTIDRAIRTYKAVEGVYPNQWDNLADAAAASTSPIPFAPEAMTSFLATWVAPASGAAFHDEVTEALEEAGIEELQMVTGIGIDVAPNRAHNESTNPGLAAEYEIEDLGIDGQNLAVVPTGTCGAAPAFGGAIPTVAYDGVTAPTANEIQNAYADILEGDECHMVVAFGFGGDAAASTSFSRVAVAQSPTYARQEVVDPSSEYARFIGLFHLAELADTDGTDGPTAGDTWEVRDTARLLAVIATDGSNIDQLNADAQAN